MLGMLRRRNIQFISKYKQECFTTIKTVVKQLVLEALADNDCDADGPYNIEQAQILDLNKWIELMDNVTRGLVKLLLRIKVNREAEKKVNSCQYLPATCVAYFKNCVVVGFRISN